jgi:hypothetical protein
VIYVQKSTSSGTGQSALYRQRLHPVLGGGEPLARSLKFLTVLSSAIGRLKVFVMAWSARNLVSNES